MQVYVYGKNHFRRYPLEALSSARLDLRIHNESAASDSQRHLKVTAAFPETGWIWNVSSGEYRPMTPVERIENGIDSLPKGKVIEDRELVSSTAEQDFRDARITLAEYKAALREAVDSIYATHIMQVTTKYTPEERESWTEKLSDSIQWMQTPEGPEREALRTSLSIYKEANARFDGDETKINAFITGVKVKGSAFKDWSLLSTGLKDRARDSIAFYDGQGKSVSEIIDELNAIVASLALPEVPAEYLENTVSLGGQS